MFGRIKMMRFVSNPTHPQPLVLKGGSNDCSFSLSPESQDRSHLVSGVVDVGQNTAFYRPNHHGRRQCVTGFSHVLFQ